MLDSSSLGRLFPTKRDSSNALYYCLTKNATVPNQPSWYKEGGVLNPWPRPTVALDLPCQKCYFFLLENYPYMLVYNCYLIFDCLAECYNQNKYWRRNSVKNSFNKKNWDPPGEEGGPFLPCALKIMLWSPLLPENTYNVTVYPRISSIKLLSSSPGAPKYLAFLPAPLKHIVLPPAPQKLWESPRIREIQGYFHWLIGIMKCKNVSCHANMYYKLKITAVTFILPFTRSKLSIKSKLCGANTCFFITFSQRNNTRLQIYTDM